MISRQDFFARARSASSRYTTEQLYAAYETFVTCPLSPFREGREIVAVDCGRCGNCCRRPWRIEIHLRDVLRWAAEGRHDILASLERKPRGPDDKPDHSSPVIRHLTSLLAGTEESLQAKVLSIARRLEACDGCYVLPKKDGCYYLIDGTTTACSIYDTRPEVCRRFPDVD